MKITVDTNILISATFWNGASNKLIQKAESKKIQLILSNEIIDEYIDVLNYKDIRDKIKDKKLEIKRTIEKIKSISKIIKIKENIDIIKEDPDDNKILECAKAGKVDYIVSNDNHLLKLKKFDGIPIVKPEDLI